MSQLKGIGIQPADLFSTSATQGCDLGTFATTGDGRSFRYVLAGGTTLVPGKLQQSTAEDTTNWENLAPAAAAIGVQSVTITTSTTNALNVFAGGLMQVTVTPGQGYSYLVASNTVTAAAANMVVTLVDPIQIALTTSSKIDFIPNPYSSVIVNPTTATGAIVGVAVYPITNAQYGWIQTHGATNVLAQGTVVVGEEVAASSTTAGAVVATSGVLASVGYAVTGIATTEYGSVFLTLD